MTTAALVVEERSWRRPDSAALNFYDVSEICRQALMKNGVHQGDHVELNRDSTLFTGLL